MRCTAAVREASLSSHVPVENHRKLFPSSAGDLLSPKAREGYNHQGQGGVGGCWVEAMNGG